jgi:hypothetical protein
MSDCLGSADFVNTNLVFDSTSSSTISAASGTYKPEDCDLPGDFPSLEPYGTDLGVFAGNNPAGFFFSTADLLSYCKGHGNCM